ncbi:hypothetical protein BD311DRAFT_650843, partial [Dichomitus squalens]
TIRMWDAQTGESVGEGLSNPFGRIDSLALSSDGRHIASSSEMFIVVWDVNAFTGKDTSQGPPGVHPSLINFKATASSSEDPSASALSTPPGYKEWDGWVMEKNDNLVIWVPDEYRGHVLWRGMLFFVGREALTIDFANASYQI